jgi:hypothetical protein
MSDEAKQLADLVNAPVVLTMPNMRHVRIRRDLVYSATDIPDLRLDVYEPSGY